MYHLKFTIMKKKHLFSLIVTLMLTMTGMSVSSCVATRDTTRINKVEVGMNKDDIKHLLGTPLFKNANEDVEEWGYRKTVGEIIDAEEMLFIVTFDSSGMVIGYQSVREHPAFHHH